MNKFNSIDTHFKTVKKILNKFENEHVEFINFFMKMNQSDDDHQFVAFSFKTNESRLSIELVDGQYRMIDYDTNKVIRVIDNLNDFLKIQ